MHPTAYPVFRAPGDLPNGRRILLYGAGAAGGAFDIYLGLLGVRTAAFLDTHRAGTLAGKPVFRFDDYMAAHRQPDDVIVITSSFHREIAGILKERGVEAAVNAAAFATSIGDYHSRLLGLLEDGRIVLFR